MINQLCRKWVVSLSTLVVVGGYSANGQTLTRGEDSIDAPAVCEGLCVHNVFQSNMVLQRDKPIPIWGWGKPGASVSVSFSGREQSADIAEDRSWRVTLNPLPASGQPRKMVVTGQGQSVALDNILVGDVWLLGGQSNMEFPLSRVENGNLEVAASNFDKIRILTIPAQVGPGLKKGFPRLYEWSSWSSRHFRKGDWDICSPAITRELSAIGYVFARYVHKASQVPIGVIDVSRGGTTVEAWTPDSVLRDMDAEEVKEVLADWDQKVEEFDPQEDLEKRIQKHEQWVEKMKAQGKEIPANRKTPTDLRPGPAENQNRPGNCYAGMIAPIACLSVKGAIFHQGYNNCFNGSRGADMYARVFPEMIEAWRAAFHDPEMPFGILSLCTSGTLQTRDNFTELMMDAGPFIREAQYKTFLDLFRSGDEHIGFVSTYDLNRRWYHPQLKIPAGMRIARWALSTQYGFDKTLRWKPPMVEEMKVEEGRIVLSLDASVGAVDNGGGRIEGFAIAGEDRRFHPADAEHLVTGKDDRGRPKKDMKVLVLRSPLVPNPIHYRYAWARNPMGNLQVHHNTDVPFATQRSDNWGLTEAPIDFGDTLDRRTRNEIRRTLRLQDMKRRLYETRTFLEENQDSFKQDMERWKEKWDK